MSILKFRVLLDSESSNEVFRDIQIDDQQNFEVLYRTILSSFQFEGQEMGSFYMSNDNWDKGHEIGLMDMRFSDEEEDLPSVMKEAKLADFMEAPDQKIILVYDFMRMWIFLLELLETTEGTLDKPTVALSVGMAPPEDSKLMQEDAFEGDEGYDEDYDEFGEDYEDGYNDEDFSEFNEYEY